MSNDNNRYHKEKKQETTRKKKHKKPLKKTPKICVHTDTQTREEGMELAPCIANTREM